jgi:hypothetical protein
MGNPPETCITEVPIPGSLTEFGVSNVKIHSPPGLAILRVPRRSLRIISQTKPVVYCLFDHGLIFSRGYSYRGFGIFDVVIHEPSELTNLRFPIFS